MLTTKKVIYRGIAEELQRKNVRVWDGNSSRAFLESMGLFPPERWVRASPPPPPRSAGHPPLRGE